MRLLLFIFLLAFTSCNSKEYSLEKLAAAKWEELEPGVDYIQTRGGEIKVTDSVAFIFKGISTSGLLVSTEMVPFERNQEFSAISADMATLLKQKLRGTEGYLKIDLGEFAFLQNPEIIVYLTVSLDSTTNANYMSQLRSFPGVEKVEFVSKEMARKQFVSDTGEDWDKILEDNPLPESFNLTISKDYFNEEKLQALKDSIESNLIYIDAVQLPGAFKRKEKIFYFVRFKAI